VTALAAAVLASVLSGCGATAGARLAGFAWLRPSAPPAGWHAARAASGATLVYPPGWRTVRGDHGTVSAALLDAGGRYLGYLNVTPRQGAEKLADWASFRVRHNAEEGDRAVRRLGAARGLRFRGGHGACVRDSYTTSTGSDYEEIACLVVGPRRAAVIVAAAALPRWGEERAVLERAVSATSD
jgi:hypothetical protein